VTFKVIAGNGEARLGELRVNGRVLRTPFLFPVVNFYCGAYEAAGFGGGIYRNIKEEFLNSSQLNGTFGGVLTSISQISDFNISRDKLNFYFGKDIHKWFGYNGILFVDSGGYKLMTKRGIHGKDFVIRRNPAEILDYQMRFGADIVASLDYPFLPNGRSDVRKRRMKKSIENAVWLVKNKPKNSLVYAAVHGHSEKMLKDYLSRLFKRLEKNHMESNLDGIAIGSLVPLASSPLQLFQVVSSVKKLLKEHDFQQLPIHVFGISSTMLPVLTYLGVDTFDSASYVHAAIHGTYYTQNLRMEHISKRPFRNLGCTCAVCESDQYQKDILDKSKPARSRLAPIAMHNLLMHSNEIELMREQIHSNHHSLESYVVKRFERNRAMAKLIKGGVLKASSCV
jgi:7-cyano-7-deazaguanine tRNA-ribosyltransferase